MSRYHFLQMARRAGCNLFVQSQPPPLEISTMSNAPQHVNHETEELPRELTELMEKIAELPAEHRAALAPSLGRVVESTRRRRRILTLVQEALSQLRLDMKYLMFDLDATRRERDEYRKSRDD